MGGKLDASNIKERSLTGNSVNTDTNTGWSIYRDMLCESLVDNLDIVLSNNYMADLINMGRSSEILNDDIMKLLSVMLHLKSENVGE